MIELDKNKLDSAKELLNKAHEIVRMECKSCHESGKWGPNKNCPACDGTESIKDSVIALSTDIKYIIDYWQARTLVAENELSELKEFYKNNYGFGLVTGEGIGSHIELVPVSSRHGGGSQVQLIPKPEVNYGVRTKLQDGWGGETKWCFTCLEKAKEYCEERYKYPFGDCAMYYVYDITGSEVGYYANGRWKGTF